MNCKVYWSVYADVDNILWLQSTKKDKYSIFKDSTFELLTLPLFSDHSKFIPEVIQKRIVNRASRARFPVIQETGSAQSSAANSRGHFTNPFVR